MWQDEHVIRSSVRFYAGGVEFRTESGRTVYVSRAQAAGML